MLPYSAAVTDPVSYRVNHVVRSSFSCYKLASISHVFSPELPLTSLSTDNTSHSCKADTFVDTSTKDDLSKRKKDWFDYWEPLKAADATQTLPEAQGRGSLGVSMTITWSAQSSQNWDAITYRFRLDLWCMIPLNFK